MFGYPTGLGAILVKNSSEYVLSKKYYGGGTILIALSHERFHVKRPTLHEWYSVLFEECLDFFFTEENVNNEI